VRRSLRALVSKRLVEQRRLSAGRVYQYRLLHPEFGSRPSSEPETETVATKTEANVAMAICGKCHLPRRRLHRSGLCRGCKADSDLAARVREVCAELGSDASPEQIAERLKQIAEDRGRRRLTARVRRAMGAMA
jgi:hypothetical protein